MSYFNDSFIKFFIELSNNNTTAWFNENRKTYEKEVKKPFSDFVEEMITRIQKYEPEVKITPSGAIMRINKDIRFSKDKTPYNTHAAAIISAYGKKDKSYPGVYLRLSPEGVMVYGGAYMIETAMLQKIRTYIANNLNDFTNAYSNNSFKDKFGTIQGEKSKRIPKEFQPILEKEPLIANKQFYFSASLNPAIITAKDLPEKLMDYYHAGKKMNEFLKKARNG